MEHELASASRKVDVAKRFVATPVNHRVRLQIAIVDELVGVGQHGAGAPRQSIGGINQQVPWRLKWQSLTHSWQPLTQASAGR